MNLLGQALGLYGHARISRHVRGLPARVLGPLRLTEAERANPLATGLDVNLAQLAIGVEMHAVPRELVDPRVEPDLAGRRVQHAVDTTRQQDPVKYVQDDLKTDCPDGHRACLLRFAGNQVSGEANSEVAPVGLAPPARAEVLEPVRPLELGLAALLARREEAPHPRGEEADVVRRQTPPVGAGSELHQGRKEANPLEEVRRVPERHERHDAHHRIARRVPDETKLAHRHEVLRDRPVGGLDSFHRSDDVAVKARKKAEPVFDGDRHLLRSAVGPNRLDRLYGSARLATECVSPFVDVNLETSVHQLMGRGKTCDAAADYDDLLPPARLIHLRLRQRIRVTQ